MPETDWTAGDVAVLDTETTGVDSSTDRVVEIAVVRLRKLLEVDAWSTRVNPGVPIPPEARAVHGISDEDVAGAPPFAYFIPELAARLAGAQLLVYNAPFDVPLVNAEWQRGRALAPEGFSLAPFCLAVAETLDPLVWIRDVDRYVPGKGRHQLAVTAKRWGIEVQGEAHGALADCRLAAGIARKLVEAGRISRDLAALLRRQEVRRAAQEQDFAAYRARLANAG